MKTPTSQIEIETFTIEREIDIDAPIELAFEAVLEQLGDDCEMPDGKPFPMKLEAWPGGRWYRDLGNDAGHFWGHIQVIKPPRLIEICGPLMMSFAATNHLSYRLAAEGTMTKLTFRHQAVGLIEQQHLQQMPIGWEYWIERCRQLAEQKSERA
ncbi:ATPase [Rhodopirellula sp. MGV]|nr:ATPase [Rhodopirellula sp. MGV]PNY34852.1 SRPBCC domain-containing protein [Rhodopirellula baltica]